MFKSIVRNLLKHISFIFVIATVFSLHSMAELIPKKDVLASRAFDLIKDVTDLASGSLAFLAVSTALVISSKLIPDASMVSVLRLFLNFQSWLASVYQRFGLLRRPHGGASDVLADLYVKKIGFAPFLAGFGLLSLSGLSLRLDDPTAGFICIAAGGTIFLQGVLTRFRAFRGYLGSNRFEALELIAFLKKITEQDGNLPPTKVSQAYFQKVATKTVPSNFPGLAR